MISQTDPNPNSATGKPSIKLNSKQHQAITHIDGPLLVLAGAGTGKTQVLTARIAHIVSSGKANHYNILAVTFTNKAAIEMRNRTAAQLGLPTDGLAIGTFHSLCARIVREYAQKVGLNSHFVILDTSDQLRLLKEVCLDLKVNIDDHPPSFFAAKIEGWKNSALNIDQINKQKSDDARSAKVYRSYQERLRHLNAVDFGDLLLHCLDIFRAYPSILKLYHDKWHYIMVDEYQDTNVAQYLWLRLLAQASNNICCVGDDDQSIYGWRGASVDNIINFTKHYPGANVIRLEENYRSTGHILAAANGIIAHNTNRLGKNLWTSQGDGEKIAIHTFSDGYRETEFIINRIQSLRHQYRLGDIAILIRVGAQSRGLEDQCIRASLPYRIIGGLRFYERLEIRDAIAWLRLAHIPSDDLSFMRIIGRPRRGIGVKSLEQLRSKAKQSQISLAEAAGHAELPHIINKNAAKNLHNLNQLLADWRAQKNQLNLKAWANQILEESGYLDLWRHDKSAEAPGRVENLQEFLGTLGEFSDIDAFLEHVTLHAEEIDKTQDEDTNGQVSIMTVHRAKGLEFQAVFLPGWEDGLFPNRRALEDNPHNDRGLEEERRLAYVAITRARRHATISYSHQRYLYGEWCYHNPSRFIQDIPLPHAVLHNQDTQFKNIHTFNTPTNDRVRSNSKSRVVSNSKSRVISNSKSRASSTRQPSIAQARKHPTTSNFQPGDQVKHALFGPGIVQQINRRHLVVTFGEETKTVMPAFIDKNPTN